jgi:hypothetical protein
MRSRSGERRDTAIHNQFALGDHDAAFLRGDFLSILASSRGPDNIPCVARALGCRLSPDLRQITLFFYSGEARELLEHIDGNGAIAAIFSVPSTHESLQLKGYDARNAAIQTEDPKLVNAYCEAFANHLANQGYPRDLIVALVTCDPGDLTAVTFTPAAAYSQTPGPRAGQAIGGTK